MVLEIINLWRIIHVAGMVISIGAVTVTDFFLLIYKLRKSFAKIVAKTAKILSTLIWTGLVLIGISSIGFIIEGRPNYNDFMFQLKMILTAIVFINGIALNQWITPKFIELTKKGKTKLPSSFERIAMITGIISLISWWSILFIAYFYI